MIKDSIKFIFDYIKFPRNPVVDEQIEVKILQDIDFAIPVVTSWFGIPIDIQWKITPIAWNKSFLVCNKVSRNYDFYFDRKATYHELAFTTFYIVFQRIVTKRRNFRLEYWATEMLSLMAASKLLENSAYKSYVQLIDYSKLYEALSSPVNIKAIRNYTQLTHTLQFENDDTAYKDFTESVYRCGKALEVIVGWDNLRKLAQYDNFDAWLNAMEHSKRDLVSVALNISAIERIPPVDFNSLYQLGLSSLWLGDYPSSLEAFQRASSVRADSKSLYYHMSLSLKALGRLGEAVVSAKMAQSLSSLDLTLNLNVADLLLRNDESEEAIALIKKMTMIFPSDPKAYEWLGYAYLKSADRDLSKNSLEISEKLGGEMQTIRSVR